jgi:hypothetical protein
VHLRLDAQHRYLPNNHSPATGVFLSEFSPAGDGHGCGRYGVDAPPDRSPVGLIRAELVGVAGRVADLNGVKAPFGNGLAW